MGLLISNAYLRVFFVLVGRKAWMHNLETERAIMVTREGKRKDNENQVKLSNSKYWLLYILKEKESNKIAFHFIKALKGMLLLTKDEYARALKAIV